LTKVFDAGLHGQKTLTKFLTENFDRVNGALVIPKTFGSFGVSPIVVPYLGAAMYH
jgi:hypothetical protein